MGVDAKLAELGLSIPRPGARGKIAKAVRSGNLVFSSGNVSPEQGKIGSDLTVEEGYQAARGALLATLGSLLEELDSLDQVTRVVKMLGFVNCAAGFCDTPTVMHGATDLLNELFGPEVGYHARSAIGVYQLPLNSAVELELIVEVA
ncbi:MAG: RidA family protein [Fimbriimonadaceae bacterium]|nr:RidA family protein [Fimbriimonadaceae bacterium]